MNGGARSSLVCRGLTGLLRYVVKSLISSACAVIMAYVDDAQKACMMRFLEEGGGCWLQTREDVVERATSKAACRFRDHVPPMAAFLPAARPPLPLRADYADAQREDVILSRLNVHEVIRRLASLHHGFLESCLWICKLSKHSRMCDNPSALVIPSHGPRYCAWEIF